MGKYIHKSAYFYGNKISDYGLEHGFVDYATLAKSFDAVLNNNVIQRTTEHAMFWDIANGDEYRYYNDDGDEITRDEYDENGGSEECVEVYQYYIISENGFSILSELTDEIVWYSEDLDMYVWGVTHWGTSWDYVLTDIRVELEA